jgi:calcineurin-like phosphoesterase
MMPGLPGYGVFEGITKSGVEYAVIDLMGRVFMSGTNDPFHAISSLLEGIKAKVVVVDFHAEATSEKVAMGWHLDGRVTAVLGTHTHVPTADERILPGGTAYQTDIGMSGPYDSVIGVEKDLVLHRFLTGMPGKFEAAKDVRHTGDLRSLHRPRISSRAHHARGITQEPKSCINAPLGDHQFAKQAAEVRVMSGWPTIHSELEKPT